MQTNGIVVKNSVEFANAVNGKNIFVYGAGFASKVILRWLAEKDCFVKGILVTDHNNNPCSLFGLPVYTPNEIKETLSDSTVVLGVMEKTQPEILKSIDFESEGLIILKDDVINELFFKAEAKKQELTDEIIRNRNETYALFHRIESGMKRITPQPRLQYFILNIIEHCNLNCAGCNHLSTLAEEKYADLKTLTSDLNQMYLVHGDIPRIGIMGGEPLLHPELNEILRVCREIFKNTTLLLSTNGLLLRSQNNAFWDTCKKYDITIRLTRYPISLDYDVLAKEIISRGIKLDYFFDGNTANSFQSLAIDPRGTGNPFENFFECIFGNQCVLLSEGKLYTCQTIPNIKYFNKEFGENLDVEENDYIDIYKTGREETLKRLASPASFCRYCNVRKRNERNYSWKVSEKKKEEWM